MKQKNPFIYFSVTFLLGAGLMLLLSTQFDVAAGANNKPAAAVASDISSAFTYQGTLDDGGSPANGQYDFIFILIDAESGLGKALGTGSVSVNNVMVTNGRFTVQLDFGNEAYAGVAGWLIIQVSPAGANNYETLTPRQPLTAAPLALSLPNVYTNPATDFVGIGTSQPIGSGNFVVKSPINNWGGMYVATSDNAGKPFYGYSSNNDNVDAYHYYDGASSEWLLNVGGIRMTVKAGETAIVGDVTQRLADDGLVKAAVFTSCSQSGSTISRSFNNVNTATITVSSGPSFGECTIDFGFDVSQRYWTANSGGGIVKNLLVTCEPGATNSELDCAVVTLAGSGTNSNITVIIH